MIIRILIYALVMVLTSFYFFPFEFTFLPGINTKMIMAVVGLGFLVLNYANKKRTELSRDFLILNCIACGVGIASLLTMVYNTTPDDSYLTYIVSVWVWCSAAYAVLNIIHTVHGKVSFILISNYIIAVCVAQTLLAFSMQFVPAIKHFIDSILAGTGFMGKNEDRLYGLGAALDPSGLRFACVLTLIIHVATHGGADNKRYSYLYLIAYGIILFIGNIMSRTTIVGLATSVALIGFEALRNHDHTSLNDEDKIYNGTLEIVKKMMTICLIIVPVLVVSYNRNDTVRQNIRFGFEGFFALVEEGHWHTTSTDNLEHHWVFPETLESWIIGDGHIASTTIDKNYIGKEYFGFYKGTDIGYCRFLLYFGIIGTTLMVLFFLYLARSCAHNHPNHKLLFMLFLCINLIGWLKVSSDVIMVFLPFLFFSSAEMDEDIILVEE